MPRDESTGLYDPRFEKDNCGFGLIAQIDGKASHWLVQTAIRSLQRMTHRGAVAADGKTGDGCGLLLKKPDGFLRAVAATHGFKVGECYAVGNIFLHPDPAIAAASRYLLSTELQQQGLDVAGWRQVAAHHCLHENLPLLF